MIKRIRSFILQLSFKRKFLISLFVIILAMASAFTLMILHVYKGSKELLYHQIHSNMSFSADALDDNISFVYRACDIISFDQDVHNSLSDHFDHPNYTTRREVYNKLTLSISRFYDQLRPFNVPYVIIKADDMTINNYYPKEKMPTDEMLAHMEQIAKDQKGRISIITQYSSTHGIFLVRDIRRFTPNGFDSLATLILCIDTDAMLDQANQALSEFSGIRYVLRDADNLIYSSVPREALDSALQECGKNYSVMSIDGESFFASRFHIEDYDWDYYLFLPYDSVDAPLKTIRNITLVWMSLLIPFCLFIMWRLVYSMLHHLDVLVDKIRLFSETQKLDASRAYSQRKDEIGYLHRQFDQMAININRLIQKNYTLEILRKDAEIKQLKAQINPHFLYNTLDSINWRAKASGDKVANTMVESLAALLRASMESVDQITLQEEVTLVKHYLTIQSFRYSDNLDYEISIPESCLGMMIPPITLQPLVENSIRYSLEQEGELCEIQITASLSQGIMHLKVYNTGSQFEDNLLQKLEQKAVLPHGMGVGLLNIHHRFQLLYGEQYGLHLYNEDDMAVVEITLPAQLRDTEGESYVPSDDR